MSKKAASLENVNLYIVNQKIDEYIAENKMKAIEPNCRLVKLVLRHKVHHFPLNIPFISVVKKCAGEKQVVFNIKRGKITDIQDIAISAETKVSEEAFVIDNVKYQKLDTIHGHARYQPVFTKK